MGVGVPPVRGAGGRSWVCVVCVVSVCLRGCVVVRCVPWCRGSPCCLSSSAAPVPPSRPLPRVVVLCAPCCRGLWLCSLLCVHPLLLSIPCVAGVVPSFFGVPFVSRFTSCGAFYTSVYPPLLGPPSWRAFFPASLVSLCVARLFPLPTSSLSWSSLSCSAMAFHLSVLFFSAPSWSSEMRMVSLMVTRGLLGQGS